MYYWTRPWFSTVVHPCGDPTNQTTPNKTAASAGAGVAGAGVTDTGSLMTARPPAASLTTLWEQLPDHRASDDALNPLISHRRRGGEVGEFHPPPHPPAQARPSGELLITVTSLRWCDYSAICLVETVWQAGTTILLWKARKNFLWYTKIYHTYYIALHALLYRKILSIKLINEFVWNRLRCKVPAFN